MTQETTVSEPGVEAGLARHGKVSYLEIPALDVAKSAAFYARVFGWNAPESERSFSDVSDGLIGHFVTGREPADEGGVAVYIYVSSVDKTLADVGASGGATVKELYPEGDLWVATFRDPAGNLMGMWQAGPR